MHSAPVASNHSDNSGRPREKSDGVGTIVRWTMMPTFLAFLRKGSMRRSRARRLLHSRFPSLRSEKLDAVGTIVRWTMMPTFLAFLPKGSMPWG